MLAGITLSLAFLSACGGGGGSSSGSSVGGGSGSGSGGGSGGGLGNFCFNGNQIAIQEIRVVDKQTNQPLRQDTQGFYLVKENQPFIITIPYTTNARCVVFSASYCDPVYCGYPLALNGYYESKNPSVQECVLRKTYSNSYEYACSFGVADLSTLTFYFRMCVQDLSKPDVPGYCDEKTIKVRREM